MSDEVWVTPSDVVLNITPQRGNTRCGQRGSRRMAVLEGNERRIQGLDKLGNGNSITSQTVNLCSEGCMCACT